MFWLWFGVDKKQDLKSDINLKTNGHFLRERSLFASRNIHENQMDIPQKTGQFGLGGALY
jgi:hypothetical protein